MVHARHDLAIQRNTKATAVIETLIQKRRSAERPPLADQTVSTLIQSVEETMQPEDGVSATHVRATLERLVSCGLATARRDGGRGGADLYRWENNLLLKSIDDHEYLLVTDERAYFLCL